MTRLRFGVIVLLVSLFAFSSIAGANIPVTGVSITVVDSPRGYTPQVPGSPTPPLMILKPGETANLRAVVTPSNASNPEVDWESSDPSIATVTASSDAVVRAVATGSVRITVTSRENPAISDAITINVRVDVPDPDDDFVDVERLILSSHKIDNVKVGDTFTLIADVYPTNARLTDIKWRTTNDTIARITRVTSSVTSLSAESKAVIRAEGRGTAEITVYVDYGTPTPISDTCVVIVGPADPTPDPTKPTPPTGGGIASFLPAGLLLLIFGGTAAVKRINGGGRS